jgi:hypothetical protein
MAMSLDEPATTAQRRDYVLDYGLTHPRSSAVRWSRIPSDRFADLEGIRPHSIAKAATQVGAGQIVI